HELRGDEKEKQIGYQLEHRFSGPDRVEGEVTEILSASEEQEQHPHGIQGRPPYPQHSLPDAAERPEEEARRDQDRQRRPRPGFDRAEGEGRAEQRQNEQDPRRREP